MFKLSPKEKETEKKTQIEEGTENNYEVSEENQLESMTIVENSPEKGTIEPQEDSSLKVSTEKSVSMTAATKSFPTEKVFITLVSPAEGSKKISPEEFQVSLSATDKSTISVSISGNEDVENDEIIMFNLSPTETFNAGGGVNEEDQVDDKSLECIINPVR